MQAGPQKSRMTRGRTLVLDDCFRRVRRLDRSRRRCAGQRLRRSAERGAPAPPRRPARRRRPPRRHRAGAHGHRGRGAQAARRSAAARSARWRSSTARSAGSTPASPSRRGLHAGRSQRRLDAVHPRAADVGRRHAAAESLPPRLPRLANDQLDDDGEPLPPGEKNYLELYGIPPSISVLRARFLQDAEHPCHDQESADALEAVETVSYVAPESIRREEHRLARIRAELEIARRKAKLATLEELAEKQPAAGAPRSSCWRSAPPRSRRWPRSSGA